MKNTEIPVEIAPESLSEQALQGIIENFILREGTDYGLNEVSLEKKSEQLRRQLSRGEIKIVYDLNTESVSLITIREWNRLLIVEG